MNRYAFCELRTNLSIDIVWSVKNAEMHVKIWPVHCIFETQVLHSRHKAPLCRQDRFHLPIFFHLFSYEVLNRASFGSRSTIDLSLSPFFPHILRRYTRTLNWCQTMCVFVIHANSPAQRPFNEIGRHESPQIKYICVDLYEQCGGSTLASNKFSTNYYE